MWKITWTLLFLTYKTKFWWFMTTRIYCTKNIAQHLHNKAVYFVFCKWRIVGQSLCPYTLFSEVWIMPAWTHTPLGTCHWIRPKHTFTIALGFQSKLQWAGRDRNLTLPYGANHTGAMPAKLQPTRDKTQGIMRTIELIKTHKRSSWKLPDTQDIPQAMKDFVTINKHGTVICNRI